MQDNIQAKNGVERTDRAEEELAPPETARDSTLPACKRNCAGCPLAHLCPAAKK
jgi:hypothetical protein